MALAAHDTCIETVDAVCGNGGCASWPASRGDWCDGTRAEDQMAGIGLCNGWSVVETLSGDQATDFFYDDNSGALIAVTQWGSQPPCEGACVLSCLAGPADLDLATLQSCVSALHFDATCE
jgi:hypothetical protein